MPTTSLPQPITLHFNPTARLMEIRAGAIVLMRVPIQRAHRLLNRVRHAATRPVRPASPLLVVLHGYIIGEAFTTIQQYQLVQEALRAIDEDGITAAELAAMWQDELQRRHEEAAHMLSDELADIQQASGLRRWQELGAEQVAWVDAADDKVRTVAA